MLGLCSHVDIVTDEKESTDEASSEAGCYDTDGGIVCSEAGPEGIRSEIGQDGAEGETSSCEDQCRCPNEKVFGTEGDRVTTTNVEKSNSYNDKLFGVSLLARFNT